MATSVVSLVVLIAVFALLMPQVASYEDALSELASIPSEWIVALVAAGILNIALYPLTVLVAIPKLGYWRGFVERQSGFLVSNTVPAGGAIAVATQYGVLAHYRVRSSLAAAAVSADSVFTYLLTLGLPALAVVLLTLEGDQTSSLTIIAAILGLVLVVVSVLGIRVVLGSDDGARKVGSWGERLITPVLKRFHRPTPDLQSLLVSFRDTAHDLVHRKWRPLFVTNGIAQMTPLLVLFCALAGLGAYPDQLTLIEVFAAYSLALLLTMIPITPGRTSAVGGHAFCLNCVCD